ncbi:Protein kinase domain-containing protein [Mycena sanguinolenta]|uniref:Protein kinase domain-containing protein n=1 Tax=Mycena sanguinolenta TaxID=230812 RepID=A0A8H6YR89_9AGAR|nr:Protein kinase domain-containing protein [Mycena sanguinolenta]
MALNRRTPPTRHDTHDRKYHLRRSPTSHRLVRLESTPELGRHRPVLVPLHTNLRRRPARSQDEEKLQDDPMPPAALGSKRKRVPSANENAHAGGRPTRGSGRLKRLRSEPYEMSEAGEASEMDVDAPASTRWSASPSDDDEPLSDLSSDDDRAETTDDYLISVASAKELQRLRKDHLVRLYIVAGLSDEAEALTKNEIIDSIVAARDDLADLPPSSPRGGSSDEHENDADEEVTHSPTPAARSRFTNGARTAASQWASSPSPPPSPSHPAHASTALPTPSPAPRDAANRRACSPPPARRPSAPPSRRHIRPPTRSPPPPATRLRSRKPSATSITTAAATTFSLSAPLSSASVTSPAMFTNGVFPFPQQRATAAAAPKTRAKGKGKQVEFTSPPKQQMSEQEKERERERQRLLMEESDLTELDDDEDGSVAGVGPVNPSPRRLRSKDKEREREGVNGTVNVNGKGKENVALKVHTNGDALSRRVTPARRAKQQSQPSACGNEDDDEDVLIESDAADDEEDEVDQLATPVRSRHNSTARWGQKQQRARSPCENVQRTPLARRLRPRTRKSGDVQPPPSDAGDGDDEQEDDEDEEEGEDEETVDGDEEGESFVEEDEDEEQTVAVEPRKLRNGKIVGDDVEMDDEEGEEEDGEEAEEDGEEAEEDGEEAEEDGEEAEEDVDEVEADADGETEDAEVEVEVEGEEDEPMEDDDVDLTIATAKTLVRLRRDDLVRLCETRDLEAVGTKPQLAEALLQWRDRQADASSPSAGGGTTPSPQTPVLLRSERVHIDEPRTPEPKEAPVGEPELELDLESLGLEDREIPPDKLQKLEKIGSGGFKDVFIGKFRGRRIAISEFRGQLSAMDIKELKLLGGFDHPNIVRFLGVSIPENTRETPVMIVSELCSNGDLFDYVRNVPAPSLNKVLTMMLDIARGLEYLHLRKPSVIHRDCKSSNILITAKGTAKIADFGLAKVKQSTRSMVRSLVGTVNWQAPELWHAHPKYNHKVDVFSCAMVYWEMLQWHAKEKKFPWEGMNEHAIYDIVGNKRQRPSVSNLRKQWSSEIVDLIERMWAHQHDDRPTMSEVVEALEEMKR